MARTIAALYKDLHSQFGPLKWWHGSSWQICVGTILTQNTNWNNVEKALANMKTARIISPQKICATSLPALQKLIKPSGFYRQKAARLKTFSRFALSFPSLNNFFRNVTREQLLALNGIGPESADSILLYACGKPYFVIDAYTRRLLCRLKIINGKESYGELQSMFHNALPRSVKRYKEFHALIVEHAKQSCKKEPLCETCILKCPKKP